MKKRQVVDTNILIRLLTKDDPVIKGSLKGVRALEIVKSNSRNP